MCNDNHTHRHLFPSRSGRGVRVEGGLLEKGRKAQRGASLIMVLFLLVVVSLLAASMARLNRGGSNAVSMEIQSTRALFAAESGTQLMAMQIFPLGGIEANAQCPAALPQVNNFTVNGLNNCIATVNCNRTATAGRNIFTLTSTGECAIGTNDYARRKITVGLRSM